MGRWAWRHPAGEPRNPPSGPRMTGPRRPLATTRLVAWMRASGQAPVTGGLPGENDLTFTRPDPRRGRGRAGLPRARAVRPPRISSRAGGTVLRLRAWIPVDPAARRSMVSIG